MLEELQTQLQNYLANWDKLVELRQNQDFFKRLKPVAVGWKVADKAEYDQIYEELRLQCDKIVETWMNERWIAKLHLKQGDLPGDITIIKLMQRRPGSDDRLGLDHVDFYSPTVIDGKAILANETGLKWSEETNDVVDDYNWLSVWFDGTEAKLKSSTVLDIIARELQDLSKTVKG